MDYIHNNKVLRLRRQELRNNSTPQEKRLWFYLRHKQLGHLFYRQHSIGPYVVDFYCPKLRLVIELDGSQHSEIETKQYDQERTVYLEQLNHTVLRFWNSEVDTNIKAVVGKIKSVVAASDS